jgi:hypothetical protein
VSDLNCKSASGFDSRVAPFFVPIGQEPQRRFVGRSGFGGVDDEDLVGIARWVECLLFNGEIAHERMVVRLGSRGQAFDVVV